MYKRCTKCGTEYHASLLNFAPRKDAKDGLRSECRACRRKWSRASCKKYYRTEKGKEYHEKYYEKYRGTKEGWLQAVYHGIGQRCSDASKNPRYKSYHVKGIRNRFPAADVFIDYVINIMQVDPRGKQIHRIDDSGHYEPGNIEFLTRDEHVKIHVEMRKHKNEV